MLKFIKAKLGIVILLAYLTAMPFAYSKVKSYHMSKQTNKQRWTQFDRFMGCLCAVTWPLSLPALYACELPEWLDEPASW